MSTRFWKFNSLFALLLVLGIATLALIGCGGGAAPTASPPTAAPAKPRNAPAQPSAVPAQPTAAPQPTSAPPGADNGDDVAFAPSNAAAIDRKIIKNAQVDMTVEDTPIALMRITGIATDVGGYVVGSRTYGDGDRTGAQISIAVPVDRFEEALNLVRRVALRINQDITSSSEVTEQYIDLESRLRNLEATAARLRDFLNRAQTITETLSVNTELTRVEQEIEQIKGKLNALSARSSFSTITADLREPRPTPSPTHTPTITPSPTPTETPTPNIWRPGETLNSAVTVQTNLLQGLGTLTIWVLVVLLPYVIAALLIGLGVRWVVRKTRKSLP
ncbi:MAG: DUF4349 domain-containing protein [Chloroflexi bacterium]|nr:DUF4349 domain-containing protein [Chloroflexota bacterium]